MVAELTRRSVAVAVLGGAILAGVGGYSWNEYTRRHHLDLSLIGRNESSQPVELSLVVLEDGDVFYERGDKLGATGEENPSDEQQLAGPWIKQDGRYSLEISAVGESMKLSNEEILDELGAVGWGVKRAHVEISITEDQSLAVSVSSEDPG